MTTLFNYEPYYDDFDEDKNFLRVLFRPGYAVQARELTQLQTILSNQIEKFGNHIFKSGSPVIGGKISLDQKPNYLVLKTQYGNEDIVLENFLNKVVVSFNSTKKTRARVIAIDNTTSNPILILKHLSGDYFAANDELKISGQEIYAQVITQDEANALPHKSVTGNSYVASIQDGIYYFKGQFVKVVSQFLVLELFYKVGKDSTVVYSQPSYKVGVEFENNIADEIDDISLLDPAQGSFNYQAPGATRFQVITRLSKRTLNSTDSSSFFEVIRLVNGVKTKEIDYPVYSEIEKTLARRTYDESGNYTVDPFVLSLEEGDKANGYFNVVLDPGKAYVGGYEFQTIAPTTIKLERARDTANVSGYDLPTYYGSSVVLDGIQGSLSSINLLDYPLIDIHCVKQEFIDSSTEDKYNATKIGTVNFSMVRYNDATDSLNANTHSLTFNVFNPKAEPISGTLGASDHSNVLIKIPATFPAALPANTYQNMYFSITDGAGLTVNPILIVSSNTTTINLASSLPFVPASNSFSIQSDIRKANSFTKFSGTTKYFGGDVNTDSKDVNGLTYINESSKTSALFTLPYPAIKAGTIDNCSFYAKKFYTAKPVSGTVATIVAETGDTFPWAGTPGSVSDELILQNIICFVRSSSAANTQSNIVPNRLLSLANNYFTVTAVSPNQITIDYGTVGVEADVILTTKVNNAQTAALRQKTMKPTSPTYHEEVPTVIGGATLSSTDIHTISGVGYVFADLGVTYFDDVNILSDLRTPGKSVSLQVPDVYEIVKIVDSQSLSQNVTTNMLSSASHDVTNSYSFDNGQRKSHYDHATITLKRGYSSPTGRIYVQYKYLDHSDAPAPQTDGLFTVDSYLGISSNMTYDDIHVFNNAKEGEVVQLRSALDFRPTRQIGSSVITGAVNPHPLYTATLDYDYYLSRIDQIVVKPSKEFSVVRGKSAISPKPTPVDKNDMLIYTLALPAYTESVRDVISEFKNNRRFTMSDIGTIERRIRSLEYYVSLNSLEKDTSAIKVLDSNGLERSKYGILVDNFTTRDSQDDSRGESLCKIEDGQLKPQELINNIELHLQENDTVDYKIVPYGSNFSKVGTGKKQVLMLNYTSTELAKQPYATKTMPIAAALFANFSGNLKLYPEYTADLDTKHAPNVVMDAVGGLSDVFTYLNDAFKYISNKEPQWTDDKNSPFAKIPESSFYQTRSTITTEIERQTATWDIINGRKFKRLIGQNQQITTITNETFIPSGTKMLQNQITTSTTEQEVGSFVSDISVQPFIKSRKIYFSADKLRPDTSFYHFFDSVNVDNYVVRPNVITAIKDPTFNPSDIVTNFNNYTKEGQQAIVASSKEIFVDYLLKDYVEGNANTVSIIDIVSHDPDTNTFNVINETGQTLTGKYLYFIDTGYICIVSNAGESNSGVIASVSSATELQLGDITIEKANSSLVGETIHIVRYPESYYAGLDDAKELSKQGVGLTYEVLGHNISTNTITIDDTSLIPAGSTYSIGKNKTTSSGKLGGAFYIPPATFRNGDRVLRVSESFNNTYDTDAISFAQHSFVSSGMKIEKTNLINTVYNVGVSPQIVDSLTSDKIVSSTTTTIVTGLDPLAQTFFVDGAVYPNGVFLKDVSLFFKNKDDILPVSVEVRPTVNGAPHSDYWIPESVVVKYPSEIKVSDSPSTANANTMTTFEFANPVFLKPGLHCVVIKTDAPEYTVWIAEKGATTTNNEFVDKNPYIGTLYKSQNSMEYVPIINEDLMFILNRCSFTNQQATLYLTNKMNGLTYNVDAFRMNQISISPMTNDPIVIDYSFKSKPKGSIVESQFRSFIPEIKNYFGEDNSLPIGSRRREISDSGDFQIRVQMSSSDSTISPVLSLEGMSLSTYYNLVDNATLQAEDINVITSGAGYSNANSIIVVSSSGGGASINVKTNGTGNAVGATVLSGGSGYLDDFTVQYSLTPNVTANATIVINSEFDSSGGPCDAKYVTKPVVLADGFDAGDLRVYLSANKPGNTEVSVFYKILASSDETAFEDRPYQKMVCMNPNSVPSKTFNDFLDYEFRPSAVDNFVKYTSVAGVTFETFKTFAIKIVMTSDDPAIVPRIKDLRVIALPAE